MRQTAPRKHTRTERDRLRELVLWLALTDAQIEWAIRQLWALQFDGREAADGKLLQCCAIQRVHEARVRALKMKNERETQTSALEHTLRRSKAAIAMLFARAATCKG